MSGDESRDELEAMLRAMPLRPPTPRLDARVRARLLGQSKDVRLKAAVIAVAAMIVLVITVVPTILRRGPSGPLSQVTSRPAAQPAAAKAPPPLWVERRQVRTEDEGVVGFAGDVPLQRFRRQTVRQIWVIDPARNARVSVSIPQEQVVVVPLRAF